MSRNLLLMTYCFPPANIIGAVRPYQIARYFKERGWTVHVISTADSSIQDTYSADCRDIHTERLQAPRLVSWLNTSPPAAKNRFGKLLSTTSRALKFIIRSVVFPEHYVLLKQAYIGEATRLAESIQFNLVISSALPFTIHIAAKEFCSKTQLPWVADNRDLWASSPYRRVLPLRRTVDCFFERYILSHANLVLGISNGMVDYYRTFYSLENVLLVMNGYEVPPDQHDEGLLPSLEYGEQRPLKIVYAGILYGGVRDPTPLLDAVSSHEQLVRSVEISFFGSEAEQVSVLMKKFPLCSIARYERVTKTEIAAIYRNASVLLVVLGEDTFENSVLTGKFFEYLAFNKPILAIAPEKSELGELINQTCVGLASKSPERIAAYLQTLLDGTSPKSITPPTELSIDHQLALLYGACEQIA